MTFISTAPSPKYTPSILGPSLQQIPQVLRPKTGVTHFSEVLELVVPSWHFRCAWIVSCTTLGRGLGLGLCLHIPGQQREWRGGAGRVLIEKRYPGIDIYPEKARMQT